MNHTPATSPPPQPSLRQARWAIAGILLLAALLRWHNLGERSFWLDESWDINRVQRPLPEVVAEVAGINYPPLHQITQHFVFRVLPVTERNARLVAFLFSVGLVGAAYLVARRMTNETVALPTALWLALSPYLIELTHAGRMYMVYVALGLLATWLLLARMERDKPGLRIGYIACITLAAYTHYLTAIIVVAQATMLLANRNRSALSPRRLLLDLLIVQLLFAPWWVVLAQQLAFYPDGPLIFEGEPQVVRELLLTYGRFANNLLSPISPLLIALLALIALLWGERRTLRLLVPVLAGLALVALLLARSGSYFMSHYMLFAVPFLALLAIYGASRLPHRGAAWGVIVLLLGEQLCGTAVQALAPRDPEPWRDALPHVRPYTQAPNMLIVLPLHWIEPLRTYGIDESTIPDDFNESLHGYILQRMSDHLRADNKVLIVSMPGPAALKTVAYINQNLNAATTQRFEGIVLYHYDRGSLGE